MGSVDQKVQEVELRHPQLWWCLSGTVRIRIRARAQRPVDVVLGVGDAVRVDQGSLITVTRSLGSVSLGFRIASDSRLPFDHDGWVTVGRVPTEWEDALISHFADSLRYLRSAQPTAVAVVPGYRRPPMPLDPAARSAARIIMDELADPIDVREIAAAVFLSTATLNRRFRTDTALSVGQWRSRLRLAVAAEHLRSPGATLDATAHQVGLSSASALCRLFRAETGTTPASYRRAIALNNEVSLPTPPTDAGAVVRSTWPRTNRLHILLWAYRGRCHATVGEQTVEVQEGELVWLPAGVPNHVTTEPGGMVLPVGARAGRAPGNYRPVIVTGDQDRLRLIDTVGREYDPLIPELTATVDNLLYAFLSADGHAAHEAHSQHRSHREPRNDIRESRLLGSLLTEFRRAPADNLTMVQWIERLTCTATELQEALDIFGIPDLRQWTSHVRMVSARRLLASGIPVASVAEHLGYSSTSSFSHVFRRAHGVGPRDYVGHV